MISFTDITESIYHIRVTSKKKANKELILNFLRKKDQYSDLPDADLEEEINTLVSTGPLFKNDKNSLFFKNLANMPTKDQENEIGFEHNTDDEAGKNDQGANK